MIQSIAQKFLSSSLDQVLKAIAALYGQEGEPETEEYILDEIERVVSEKGYPPDLTPPPRRPTYTFADKWYL